jgi:hypothetical protein
MADPDDAEHNQPAAAASDCWKEFTAASFWDPKKAAEMFTEDGRSKGGRQALHQVRWGRALGLTWRRPENRDGELGSVMFSKLIRPGAARMRS